MPRRPGVPGGPGWRTADLDRLLDFAEAALVHGSGFGLTAFHRRASDLGSLGPDVLRQALGPAV